MTDPWLAIVNPAAGGGRCGKQARAAIERLREGGVGVDVAETTRAGEASDLARDAWGNGRRRFIAVGGDGTGYEIVNGLFPAAAGAGGPRPTLGFLPLGTGNSFLRDFTEQGAEHSIESLLAGRSRACDVLRLRCSERVLHSINLISVGFVAEVNGLRARRFKRWGEAGYVAAVVTAVVGLQATPVPMRVDGGELDDAPLCFASFNNSRFTGGKMMMAPDADTADGLIELVRVGPMGRIELLRTFPKIFKGTHVRHPAVTTAKPRSIDFSVDREIDLMIDGEAERATPQRLDVLAGAIDVAV
jgi:YegS/Rv2252/BmrU family lipid kinase